MSNYDSFQAYIKQEVLDLILLISRSHIIPRAKITATIFIG